MGTIRQSILPKTGLCIEESQSICPKSMRMVILRIDGCMQAADMKTHYGKRLLCESFI